MTRLLMVGYFGEGNLGDEAVLQGAVQALRSRAPDVLIYVLWGDKGQLPKGAAPVNRRNPLAIIRALLRCRVVLAPGGSLFQDITGPASIPYYGGILFMAHFFGAKTAALSQGFGPLTRFYAARLLKFLLSHIDVLTARDKSSQKQYRALGLQCGFTHDPAFCLPPPGTRTKHEKDSANRQPTICIAPRNYAAWPEDSPHIAKALQLYHDRGYRITGLAMKHEDIEAIQALSHLSGLNISEYHPANAEKAMKILARADLVIAVRLHAMLLALAAGVTVISIGYDPKVISLADLYNVRCLKAGSVSESQIYQDSLVNSVNCSIRPSRIPFFGSLRMDYSLIVPAL